MNKTYVIIGVSVAVLLALIAVVVIVLIMRNRKQPVKPTPTPLPTPQPVVSYDFRTSGGNVSNTSYDDLKNVCTAKGMRVCNASEICSNNGAAPNELQVFGSNDNWVAVGDKPNEWITLSAGDRYCKTHSQVAGDVPTWGTSNSNAQTTWDRAVKCCK